MRRAQLDRPDTSDVPLPFVGRSGCSKLSSRASPERRCRTTQSLTDPLTGGALIRCVLADPVDHRRPRAYASSEGPSPPHKLAGPSGPGRVSDARGRGHLAAQAPSFFHPSRQAIGVLGSSARRGVISGFSPRRVRKTWPPASPGAFSSRSQSTQSKRTMGQAGNMPSKAVLMCWRHPPSSTKRFSIFSQTHLRKRLCLVTAHTQTGRSLRVRTTGACDQKRTIRSRLVLCKRLNRG